MIRPPRIEASMHPTVVLELDLATVQHLDDRPWLIGQEDTHHAVYIVDDDGRLQVFAVDGSFELRRAQR